MSGSEESSYAHSWVSSVFVQQSDWWQGLRIPQFLFSQPSPSFPCSLHRGSGGVNKCNDIRMFLTNENSSKKHYSDFEKFTFKSDTWTLVGILLKSDTSTLVGILLKVIRITFGENDTLDKVQKKRYDWYQSIRNARITFHMWLEPNPFIFREIDLTLTTSDSESLVPVS